MVYYCNIMSFLYLTIRITFSFFYFYLGCDILIPIYNTYLLIKNESNPDNVDLIGSLNIVYCIKRHTYQFSIDDLKLLIINHV